jgi:hypothetical protein
VQVGRHGVHQTMSHIEAMKQALEALESYHGYMEPLTTVFGGPRIPAEQSTTGKVERAIKSLRQAIEAAEKQVSYSGNGTAGRENMTAPTGFFFQMPKAEKQEPDEPDELTIAYMSGFFDGKKKREWVGLTEEDLSVCDEDGVILARYWEAKLREKNGC